MRERNSAFSRRCASLLVLLLSVSTVLWAGDSKPAPYRKLGIHVAGGQITATFSYRDLFQSYPLKKLKSGLPTRVVLQIGLERRGEKPPVGYYVRSTEVVYDLWDETFLVTEMDHHRKKQKRVATTEEVLNLAGVLRQTKVLSAQGLEKGRYRLHVIAELNPVSKEMVENIRRWLAHPRSTQRSGAGQTNFFGSFVGVFVDRRIGEAQAQVSFVSQWFAAGDS